jgi:D-alanyl-lipoteichoic acid acyltransferase DltB (MBOAT superfamily)
MLFNSLIFVVFFFAVYTLYLVLHRHLRAQNRFLLLASYIFYGYWDWRFLSLIFISTLVDYYLGRTIYRTEKEVKRKRLLILSVLANLSLLGFFKYFNFFVSGAVDLASWLGVQLDLPTLKVILPVGISFYTFQTRSYTIDVYRGELAPSESLLDVAVFVALFPQLVAGPIERAKSLLPQVSARRVIERRQVEAAIFLILWGSLKKIALADPLGQTVAQIFGHYHDYSGLDLTVGALCFALQIYGDFSGYSDIARGLGKLMGFELMVNFRLPYLAENPRDFWARWHISLSTWLRDYLYIPLGGNRGGTWATYRNLFITMALGGLWHGAAMHFVVWGVYHGLLLIGHRAVTGAPAWQALVSPWYERKPRLLRGLSVVVMWGITLVGWIIFRASTMDQVLWMTGHLGLRPSAESGHFLRQWLVYGLPLYVMAWLQCRTGDLLAVTKWPPKLRCATYAGLLIWAWLFAASHASDFIYFQF